MATRAPGSAPLGGLPFWHVQEDPGCHRIRRTVPTAASLAATDRPARVVRARDVPAAPVGGAGATTVPGALVPPRGASAQAAGGKATVGAGPPRLGRSGAP